MLFQVPAMILILLLYIGPIFFTIFISMTKWDFVTPPEFVGFGNFVRFAKDPVVWQSLFVTLKYALLNIPSVIIWSIIIAVLLNSSIRMMNLFRTIIYVPTVVPAIANAVLWLFLLNPVTGIVNKAIGLVGIPPQNWLYDKFLVIPSFVLMSIWTAGGTIIIILAGLQGISADLYEAMDVDGGGFIAKFFHVTLPMLTPVIFYNVVTGIIDCLQTFSQAFVMTSGGPNNASLFYMLNLYRTAFKYNDMGYASTMALILFAIIAVITIVLIKFSGAWVYDERIEK